MAGLWTLCSDNFGRNLLFISTEIAFGLQDVLLTIREEPPPSAPLAAGAWPSLSSGGGAAFPASERPVALFDGSTLNGWTGKIGRYFFAENGSIVARNNPADPLGPSTALLTDRSFRNFRLVFEQRLVVSEMHSGGESLIFSMAKVCNRF